MFLQVITATSLEIIKYSLFRYSALYLEPTSKSVTSGNTILIKKKEYIKKIRENSVVIYDGSALSI